MSHEMFNEGAKAVPSAELAELDLPHSMSIAQARSHEPPKAFTHASFRLYMICAVGFLCSTMGGYNGYLLNGLLQNKDFKEYFHGANTGIWVGVVASFIQFGALAAIPFSGPALDTWGRRRGILIGACIVVVGTIMQGTVVYTHSLKQFMMSRFFLGFGAQLSACGGPIYVIEMSHPAFRGVTTGLFQTFWWTGAILASGAVRGAMNLTGNRTWLLPVWLQLLCPVTIAISILFLPESPRWLYVNKRETAAMDVITKYHGVSNPESVWVKLQKQEYHRYLKPNGADKNWWDYRILFRDRSSIYRLVCSILVVVFAQSAGNTVLELLLSAVLDTAGIRNPVSQSNLNLGLSCLQLIMAVTGACLVDFLGRRRLFLFTNTILGLVWLGMTITGSLQKRTGSAGSAKGIVGLVFIFDVVYAGGWTSLQALYPVEILPFEMRAKGYAISQTFETGAGLLNTFVWPVALDKIAWKTYILLTLWCFFQATVIYFVIPETRRRTLEEIDNIFKEKNPRKASVQKQPSFYYRHSSQS